LNRQNYFLNKTENQGWWMENFFMIREGIIMYKKVN